MTTRPASNASITKQHGAQSGGPNPSAVVFDLGKVLLDFDYQVAARALQPRCRSTRFDLRQLLDQSPLLHRYESNRLSTEQFFDAIRQAAGFLGDLDEFCKLFADIFNPIPAMIDLHASLRRRNVPVYIFSNTNEIAVRHIRRRYPFFAEFNGHILSYEHNSMKPDPALYEVVERVAGLSGPELLYIDDREENIETALVRGWTAVHHRNPDATIRFVHSAFGERFH